MAYEKQNFLDGQIVTADHLNHIENGIVAAWQPRNLLDNSYFTNPVNQRGETSYQTPWGMTIDRWYLSSYDENNATLTLTTNGVVITPGTSGIAAIAQRLSSEDLHADKAYTALAQTLDGTYITGTVENHTDTYGFYQIGFKVSTETTLVWAALYEGSYDASTLPPYVPKGYAAEVAECQRYYYKTVASNWDGSVCNAIGSNAYAPLYITFPVPMRITPTVSNGVSSCDVFGTGTVSASITNASVDRWHYACMATVSSSYGGKIIKPIGTVEFSADL